MGSHYNTGPYINFPHFGNSNLGKLPDVSAKLCSGPKVAFLGEAADIPKKNIDVFVDEVAHRLGFIALVLRKFQVGSLPRISLIYKPYVRVPAW